MVIRALMLGLCGVAALFASASAESIYDYPRSDGVVADLELSQFRRQFPEEPELLTVSPKEIFETLSNKTVIANIAYVRESIKDGISYQTSYNHRTMLVYFDADGSLAFFSPQKKILFGRWAIADDKLITLYIKSQDPDGATRISITSFPLARFIRGIGENVKDGDFCEMSNGSVAAIVYSANGSLESSRLGPACGRRTKK